MAALVVVAGLGCSDEVDTTGSMNPVFECSEVENGAYLDGAAEVTGSDVVIQITSTNGTFTEAPMITDVSEGTVGNVTVLNGVVQIPISGVGASVSFTLTGRLTGPDGTVCDVSRNITVTVPSS